jgi:hypothetical protein
MPLKFYFAVNIGLLSTYLSEFAQTKYQPSLFVYLKEGHRIHIACGVSRSKTVCSDRFNDVAVLELSFCARNKPSLTCPLVRTQQ